jgi:hypothetical protein
MKKLVSYKFAPTILLFLFVAIAAFGQEEITGKYLWTDYPSGYIMLNADKSFKFKFRSHAYWDLACGQFEVKIDTIFFNYMSDMFDVSCNNERLNMTDTSDYFLKKGVDKRHRPIIALLLKNKLEIIKTGDVNELETIGDGGYYYRRAKRK